MNNLTPNKPTYRECFAMCFVRIGQQYISGADYRPTTIVRFK